MGKRIVIIMLVCCSLKVQGQAHEIEQLLLNVEKLAQFKQILSDMEKGYEMLTKGYTAIKNISEGNFNLHKVFLDALFEVSPSVRKYKKIADIVNMQVRLVSQYKSAFDRFKKSEQFTESEVQYLSRVYGRLLDESISNLDDLTMVVTAGKLRMSDEERLSAIDRIHVNMEDKLHFLNDFNGKTGVLAMARAKASGEAKVLEQLYQKE